MIKSNEGDDDVITVESTETEADATKTEADATEKATEESTDADATEESTEAEEESTKTEADATKTEADATEKATEESTEAEEESDEKATKVESELVADEKATKEDSEAEVADEESTKAEADATEEEGEPDNELGSEISDEDDAIVNHDATGDNDAAGDHDESYQLVRDGDKYFLYQGTKKLDDNHKLTNQPCLLVCDFSDMYYPVPVKIGKNLDVRKVNIYTTKIFSKDDKLKGVEKYKVVVIDTDTRILILRCDPIN